MTFPVTRLGITVEAALGVLTAADPTAWPWVDLSARLLDQGFTITRGRENEASGLQPATTTFELDNRDGWLTPNNPVSPWWPYYRRGTPIRITLEGARKAAFGPGGIGSYWSTPHTVNDNISGDLDVRVRVHPDNWATIQGQRQHLLSCWGTAAANDQWDLALVGTGALELGLMDSGGTDRSQVSNQLVASLRPIWLGATIDVNNGAGGRVYTFYSWDDADTPPADITTWTLVESFTVATAITLRTGSTEPIKAFARLTTEPAARGQMLAAQVRNGINGTVVLNADFTAVAVGATSFTDTTGRVWTRQGTATISTQRTRFFGTIDSVATTWPYGAHNATVQGTNPSECRSRITISDVVRRLGQGSKPLSSALRRIVTSSHYVGHVLAYWPMEDARGSQRLASGLPGGLSMAQVGLSTEADSTLASSAPLPTIPSDSTSSWQGAIGGSSPTHWVVELFWRAMTGPPDPYSLRIFQVWSEGTVGSWSVSVSSTTFTFAAWNTLGVQVVNFQGGFSATQLGPWVLVRMEVIQNGGNIDWSVAFTDLDTGFGGAYSDSVAGTLGSPRTVLNWLGPNDAPNGASMGHLIVTDGQLGSGWMAGADTAWVGETAAHRIWRLSREENGLPAEIIGDPATFSAFRGDLTYSQPLGYQGRADFLTLVDQAAEVDMGILSGRTTGPGLTYRCRQTIDNQAVQLVLDATSNAVTIPLTPTLDDQRLRNDVTVPIIDGTSARAVDVDSVAAEGAYQVEIPAINGVGGVSIQDAIIVAQSGLDLAITYQADWQAGWRLALGVQGALVRYPQILVDLSLAPQLLDDWHALALGDRVQLVGLPNQHPSEAVDLIIEHIGDQISPTSWIGVLAGSPGAPYILGTLDA